MSKIRDADESPSSDPDDSVLRLENLRVSDRPTVPQVRQRAISTSTWERETANKSKIKTNTVLEQRTKSSKHYARKLRNRGLPKKKGGGGAFIWGLPGSEVDADVDHGGAIDHNDPNYESDEEPFEVIRARMMKANLRKNCSFENNIKPILEEYFFNGDAQEFIEGVSQWELGSQRRSDLVQFIIVLSMERQDIHRELISSLLVPLSYEFINKSQIEKAFIDMLINLEDLVKDIPNAPEYLAKFIIRAVCDNCLASSSLHHFESDIPSREANSCLSMIPFFLDKGDIDKIWLPLVASRYPVQKSVDTLRVIVKNFFDIKMIDTTAAEIKKLSIPHFLHELVYLLLECLIEKQNIQMDIEMTCDLLKQLIELRIMPNGQMKQGLKRVLEDIPLLEMYRRSAGRTLRQLVDGLNKRKLIDEETTHLLQMETKKRRTRTICLAEQVDDRTLFADKNCASEKKSDSK
ncbi:hypothetical protein ACOME3_009436 [Neoechinorhynchus agilis]